MTATFSVASSCLLVAALGPCSAPETKPPLTGTETAQLAQRVEETPPERPPQQTQSTRAFMRDHARQAEDLRNAVIAGRFDLIQSASAVIASDAWSANLRPDYRPHVAAVQQAAGAARDARSVQASGAALGKLGAACAGCHLEHGGPPQTQALEPASKGVGTMAIHAAAEQALWEGLYTPSEAVWKRGAEHLAGAPELASDVEDVDALGRELRDLARAAAASPARAEAYGSITATCATCHRRLSIETH